MAIEMNTIESQACLSHNYRYWISRVWDKDKDIGTFICLNPSKATSLMSDTTLSNCNNLAVQWGWGGFYIVNLFAYMATKPEELRSQSDPIGTDNDDAIEKIANKSHYIILAWGNRYNDRANEVLDNLSNFSDKIFYLKKNKGGGFLHPSRIKTEDYSQFPSSNNFASLTSQNH